MQRWKNILFTGCLSLNGLLVFLLLFESRLSIPPWLQVVGRMHPLLLHFPVVLVIVYALAILIFPPAKNNKDDVYANAIDLLLLLAALSAVSTALMGLFLSREPGYDAESLRWHKWGGVAVAIFTLGWYFFSKKIQAKKIVSFSTSILAIGLIVITGHKGAGITHGQNYLLAPITPEKIQPTVSMEEAIIYTHLVKPILETKCMSCHNNKKAKGELVMETEALLLKGGKSGALWDSATADLGLMLRRVHLPLEQKKHMPPQNKPQLTDEEIEIITQWIRKGADFTLRVADLPATDTLYQIAEKRITAAEAMAYDFDEADPATIQKLNTVNRLVAAEAINSPALSVSFFNHQLFQPEHLKELSKIKEQVVSLNLSKMPVKDADMKFISELKNLRQLNLNFTAITGAALLELKKLKFLKSLSLSGTGLQAEQLRQLQDFEQLKAVYLWNTPVAAADMDKLKQQLKSIRIESGFTGDTMRLKLFPPIIQNEEFVLTAPMPLKLKHYIGGTAIRYTMDGTDPDSIHAAVFKGNETINGNVLIKAKAYKPGWISSDILEINFYKNTYKPDSIFFVIQPDPAYKGDSKLLTDLVKGEINFRLGNWLGWRQNKMEVLMKFTKPVAVQSITLSGLVDVGSYIMPPSLIQIWGGEDPKKLRLLGNVKPVQPSMLQPAFLRGFECKFDPAMVNYIKIIAIPVAKLPAWHPGKGDKAWVFTDEILVN